MGENKVATDDKLRSTAQRLANLRFSHDLLNEEYADVIFRELVAVRDQTL